MDLVYEKNMVEIYKVTPNVFYRKGNLSIRHQCNGVYLVSGGIVAAVDVATLESAQEMMEESLQLFGQPIRYIFLTHGDGDHVDGMPLFLDQPVTVVCSHRLVDEVAPEGTAHNAVFIGVDGSQRIRMGELELEVSTIPGTAHSRCDLFIRLVKEQMLCTGDTANEFQTLYYHAADVENWIATLREKYAQGGKHLLPGHGEVYPYSHLEEVADFMEVVLRAARRCVKTLTPKELLALDEPSINGIVDAYLSGGDADALLIRRKTGNDAAREVRMVIQSLQRKLQG